MWEPGSRVLYGGEGLHVAAYLVEKYSGLPYTEFVQTRILDSLGMKSTWFTYKDIPEDRRLPGHRKRKDSWEPFFKGDPKIGGSGHYFAVDAGLYSTAGDMFLWHQTKPLTKFDGLSVLPMGFVGEKKEKEGVSERVWDWDGKQEERVSMFSSAGGNLI